MGRISQWWMGGRGIGFDTEKEVRVSLVLWFRAEMYVAAKVPLLEKGKKKEDKRQKQRGFLVAAEGALPLQMRQKSGSGWSLRLSLSGPAALVSPSSSFQSALTGMDRAPHPLPGLSL